MSNQAQQFESLLYYQLQNIEDARKCLELLLNLNFKEKISSITSKSAGSILYCLSSTIPLNNCRDPTLLLKFFKATVDLTTSQSISLEAHALNNILVHLKEIWSHCLQDPLILQNLLEALSALVYQNGFCITSEHISWILTENGLIRSVLETDNFSDECKKFAVQCVAGICLVSENGEHVDQALLNECCQILIKLLLSKKQKEIITPDDCRVKFSALKGLYNICSIVEDINTVQIGPLLAVLKKFMLFGLSENALHLSDELQPIPIPDVFPKTSQLHKSSNENAQASDTPAKSNQNKKRGKRKSKGKSKTNESFNVAQVDDSFTKSPKPVNLMMQKQRPPWTRVTSSESEYSDTEGSQNAKLRSLLSKVRQMSLNVLNIVVFKMDRRSMLGYWSSFVSDETSLFDSPSLFTIIRKDPVPQARATALSVLSAMIDGSKAFLAFIADESRPAAASAQTSFVPFSVALATMIRAIHSQLLAAARSEQSGIALVQLLRALSVLVLNTPYKKLRPGLLVQIASVTRNNLSKTLNTNVKLSCLSLLAAIATTAAPLAEVANIITDSSSLRSSSSEKSSPAMSGERTPVEDMKQLSLNETDSKSFGNSWLIEECILLCNVQSSATLPMEVKTSPPAYTLVQEALQTMTCVVKGYFPVIRCYVGVLSDVACSLMPTTLPSPIRLHCVKLVQELAGSILLFFKTQTDEELEKECLSMWMKILSGPLQSVIQSGDPPLQGNACDCLSNIGSNTFQKLPQQKQLMCATILLGLTSDETTLVRSRAVRAIGRFAMYSCMQDDIAFLEDVADVVVTAMDDPLLAIRFNAAWSLGNLTDSIVINAEKDEKFHGQFPDHIIIKLLAKAINALNDKDKVRFNMMRTVGNILRYVTENHLQNEEFKLKIHEAIDAVCQLTSGNSVVKVRWNACIACSNFLRNDQLPLGSSEWTDQVYMALCSSLTSCKNFKVQIKAAFSLATPAKREHYGSVSMFARIFETLLQALDGSDSAADFTEYKFKETLQEQLCTTLVYLLSLLTSADISHVHKHFAGKEEMVSGYLENYRHLLQNKLTTHKETTKSTEAELNEDYVYAKQITDADKLQLLKNSYQHIKNITTLSQTKIDANSNLDKIQQHEENILDVFKFLVS